MFRKRFLSTNINTYFRSMIALHISPEIKQQLPAIRLGIISCTASPQPASESLQAFIQSTLDALSQQYASETVSQIPTIHQTKTAYRKLGKDPSRYRPSAEALLRRIVKGKGLYQINNLVDLLNLISVKTGFSIGGYDSHKIEGAITLGIGKPAEPYEAIGRGTLNIECLPVLRDIVGTFGSPTSDSLRTMVTSNCQAFLMVFFDFEGDPSLTSALELTKELLPQYTDASEITSQIIE